MHTVSRLHRTAHREEHIAVTTWVAAAGTPGPWEPAALRCLGKGLHCLQGRSCPFGYKEAPTDRAYRLQFWAAAPTPALRKAAHQSTIGGDVAALLITDAAPAHNTAVAAELAAVLAIADTQRPDALTLRATAPSGDTNTLPGRDPVARVVLIAADCYPSLDEGSVMAALMKHAGPLFTSRNGVDPAFIVSVEPSTLNGSVTAAITEQRPLGVVIKSPAEASAVLSAVSAAVVRRTDALLHAIAAVPPGSTFTVDGHPSEGSQGVSGLGTPALLAPFTESAVVGAAPVLHLRDPGLGGVGDTCVAVSPVQWSRARPAPGPREVFGALVPRSENPDLWHMPSRSLQETGRLLGVSFSGDAVCRLGERAMTWWVQHGAASDAAMMHTNPQPPPGHVPPMACIVNKTASCRGNPRPPRHPRHHVGNAVPTRALHATAPTQDHLLVCRLSASSTTQALIAAVRGGHCRETSALIPCAVRSIDGEDSKAWVVAVRMVGPPQQSSASDEGESATTDAAVEVILWMPDVHAATAAVLGSAPWFPLVADVASAPPLPAVVLDLSPQLGPMSAAVGATVVGRLPRFGLATLIAATAACAVFGPVPCAPASEDLNAHVSRLRSLVDPSCGASTATARNAVPGGCTEVALADYTWLHPDARGAVVYAVLVETQAEVDSSLSCLVPHTSIENLGKREAALSKRMSASAAVFVDTGLTVQRMTDMIVADARGTEDPVFAPTIAAASESGIAMAAAMQATVRGLAASAVVAVPAADRALALLPNVCVRFVAQEAVVLPLWRRMPQTCWNSKTLTRRARFSRVALPVSSLFDEERAVTQSAATGDAAVLPVVAPDGLRSALDHGLSVAELYVHRVTRAVLSALTHSNVPPDTAVAQVSTQLSTLAEHLPSFTARNEDWWGYVLDSRQWSAPAGCPQRARQELAAMAQALALALGHKAAFHPIYHSDYSKPLSADDEGNAAYPAPGNDASRYAGEPIWSMSPAPSGASARFHHAQHPAREYTMRSQPKYRRQCIRFSVGLPPSGVEPQQTFGAFDGQGHYDYFEMFVQCITPVPAPGLLFPPSAWPRIERLFAKYGFSQWLATVALRPADAQQEQTRGRGQGRGRGGDDGRGGFGAARGFGRGRGGGVAVDDTTSVSLVSVRSVVVLYRILCVCEATGLGRARPVVWKLIDLLL